MCGPHPTGEELYTFTIITTDADESMAKLHNRMPVGTVEEPIEYRVILSRQSTPEWCPSAAFVLNELAKRRERLAHGMIL